MTPGERALLTEWWREASAAEPALAPVDARPMAATPKLVQTALDALSRSGFFAGIAERLLVFDLKQVRLYLRDETVRRRARERVEQAVSDDTRVVIGHSLGRWWPMSTLPAPRMAYRSVRDPRLPARHT